MTAIQLNGAPYQAAQDATLAGLVQALGLTGQAIAVAVNRSIIPREQWPACRLQADDQVDIVRAIGGG